MDINTEWQIQKGEIMYYNGLTREMAIREKIFWTGFVTGQVSLVIFVVIIKMIKLLIDYI